MEIKLGGNMGILYLVTLIVLAFCFLKIDKIKKQQNIIMWIAITIILLMCYNCIITLILSIINLKAYLWLRSIINIVLSAIIYFKLIKNKRNQKYYFDFKDLFILVIILFSVIYIGISRFGKNINVNFETTDPAVHYLLAADFYQENTLMEKTSIVDIYGKKNGNHTMFFSYVNAGTFFQIFSNNGNYETLYKLFVIFELILFFLSGILFYYTIKPNRVIKKDKIYQIGFSIAICLLYLFGYPLSNLIFGFHYLGMGVLIVNLMILMYKIYYNDGLTNKRIMQLILIILGFCLFTTYYLFVPAIYGGIGIYILYLYKVNQKFNFKIAIKEELLLLFLPFVLGVAYYILPQFFDTDTISSSSALALEGYIYRNLFGNFVYLIPIAIFEIIVMLKRKENDPIPLVTIFTTVITICLFGLGYIGKASSYYYFKFYFILWLMMFILIGNNIFNSRKKIEVSQVYLSMYIIVVITMLLGVESKISKNNILFNPTNFTSSISDIYSFNNSRLTTEISQFNKNELKLIKYIKNHPQYTDDRNELIIVGDTLQKIWYYSLTGLYPGYNYKSNSDFYKDNLSFDEINTKKIRCFIYLENGDWIKTNKISKEYKIIYNNSSGKIMCRE